MPKTKKTPGRPEVIGSLAEYNRQFFPERYQRELEQKRLNSDPGHAMAEEFLKAVKQKLLSPP